MSAIRDAIPMLIAAFRACAIGLALFVIIALTVALNLLAELLRLATATVRIVIGFVPALARLAVVGAVALSAVWSWPRLFVEFGGDILAAIPATLFCIVPIAYMLASGHGLAGLLAAAAIVFGMGTIYPTLPTFAQGVLFACIIGATVTLQVQHMQEVRNEKQERAVLGMAADPAVAVFQRNEERKPDPDHDAR